MNYLYETAFKTGDLGLGSAVGWTLAIMILLLSAIQLRVMGGLQKEST